MIAIGLICTKAFPLLDSLKTVSTNSMDDPGDRTGPKRRGRADGNRSAVDAGERDEDCSDSDSSDSVYESTRLEDLSSSLRVFFDSVIKKQLTESEMMRSRADGNRSAVDAGERDEDCSDSDSSDSVYESTRLEDLSSSLRVFFDSVIKKELTESEMMRSREALRLEAEKRRVETDSELTQMLVQTQMQIASFVADIDSSRKRKRVGEDESPVSQRDRALMLSLLQCNFLL